MFFGLLYPLLFELSALIPDPAFSQGLLQAFGLVMVLLKIIYQRLLKLGSQKHSIPLSIRQLIDVLPFSERKFKSNML